MKTTWEAATTWIALVKTGLTRASEIRTRAALAKAFTTPLSTSADVQPGGAAAAARFVSLDPATASSLAAA